MDDSWNYIDKLCPVCGGRVRHYFDKYVCEDCGRICSSEFDDENTVVIRAHVPNEDQKTTPLPLYLKDNETCVIGTIAKLSEIIPNTLTITNCELIKMHHKELDIDFEFDTKKLENIDTIEINGHRFVRERNTECSKEKHIRSIKDERQVP